jgi:hypothetical protein
MSEPIILTERERAVFAELVSHLMGEANNRDTEYAWQLGEVLRAWLRDMEPPTESASPPRVPGPSAQFAKVGVQSGPGQPIDLAERMDKRAERLRVHDWSVSDSITAQILREAAAEVRRLRAERDAYKAGLDVARDSDREAAQLIERGCRAGIEAAARWLEAQRGDNIATPVYPVREFAAAIRALAAAPPVDPLLAGLKYALQLIEGGRQSVYADSTWDAAAHRRSGDKYFALLNAEIAARKGG